MNNENAFWSRDLCLATVLSMSFPINKMEMDEFGRAYFVFLKSDGLQEKIDSFYAGKDLVEPLSFFNHLKNLKTRIYDIKRGSNCSSEK